MIYFKQVLFTAEKVSLKTAPSVYNREKGSSLYYLGEREQKRERERQRKKEWKKKGRKKGRKEEKERKRKESIKKGIYL